MVNPVACLQSDVYVSLYGINRYVFQLFDSTFLVAHMVKNLTAVQETWVQSLGWEDSLERGKATHSSVLAQRMQGHKELDAIFTMSHLYVLGFPGSSDGKASACNAGDQS